MAVHPTDGRLLAHRPTAILPLRRSPRLGPSPLSPKQQSTPQPKTAHPMPSTSRTPRSTSASTTSRKRSLTVELPTPASTSTNTSPRAARAEKRRRLAPPSPSSTPRPLSAPPLLASKALRPPLPLEKRKRLSIEPAEVVISTSKRRKENRRGGSEGTRRKSARLETTLAAAAAKAVTPASRPGSLTPSPSPSIRRKRPRTPPDPPLKPPNCTATPKLHSSSQITLEPSPLDTSRDDADTEPSPSSDSNLIQAIPRPTPSQLGARSPTPMPVDASSTRTPTRPNSAPILIGPCTSPHPSSPSPPPLPPTHVSPISPPSPTCSTSTLIATPPTVHIPQHPAQHAQHHQTHSTEMLPGFVAPQLGEAMAYQGVQEEVYPPLQVPLVQQQAYPHGAPELGPEQELPWWEEPLHIEKEWTLWEIACRMRVWEIQKRYTPRTIRDVVAQEANDYYMAHGFPGALEGRLRTRGRGSGLALGPGMGVSEDEDEDGDGNGEDWSETESEFTDEEDEVVGDGDRRGDERGVSEGHGEGGGDLDGDEDAEGEPDPTAEDASFNAELSSPALARAREEAGAGGGPEVGIMGAFYVPPVPMVVPSVGENQGDRRSLLERITVGVEENPDNVPALSLGVDADVSAGSAERSTPPFTAPPCQPQLGYTPTLPMQTPTSMSVPDPVLLQMRTPTPPSPPTPMPGPLQIRRQTPVQQLPMLPLPPPRLGSIRVHALRHLEVGLAPFVGRGTPMDRRRAAEWIGAGGRRDGEKKEHMLQPQPQQQRQQAVPPAFNPDPADWDAFLESLERDGGASVVGAGGVAGGATGTGMDLDVNLDGSGCVDGMDVERLSLGAEVPNSNHPCSSPSMNVGVGVGVGVDVDMNIGMNMGALGPGIDGSSGGGGSAGGMEMFGMGFGVGMGIGMAVGLGVGVGGMGGWFSGEASNGGFQHPHPSQHMQHLGMPMSMPIPMLLSPQPPTLALSLSPLGPSLSSPPSLPGSPSLSPTSPVSPGAGLGLVGLGLDGYEQASGPEQGQGQTSTLSFALG